MPFYNYNGLNLYYEIQGNRETALLFIHGLGGNNKVWKYQIEHFADKYQIVTVDLFGHGNSSKEVDPVYVPRVDAEAISWLIQKEVDKPYFVIGHSFAGLIMAELIKIGDPNMKGVVFVDCTYQGSDDVIRARTAFGKMMLAIGNDTIRAETERWYGDLMGPAVSPEDSKMILSSLQYCSPRWLFQSVAACPKYDAIYPQRETPVRDDLSIFIMEADNGVGADLRKSWVNRFKNARYHLFENAHHFFFALDKEKFNGLLDDFLSGK